MWSSSRSTSSANCYRVRSSTTFFRLNPPSSLSEIYLDGNQLGCEGAYELIKLLLLDCERFLIDKQEKLRAENELKAQEGLFDEKHLLYTYPHLALLREQQGLPPELTPEEKKAKKKKKSNFPTFSKFDLLQCFS